MKAIAYHPRSNRARAAALTAIGAAHVAVIAALVTLGGLIEVIHQATPVMVQMVPATVAHAEPTRTIAPPKLRTPEIVLPNPPPTENLFTVRMEERTAPPPVPTQVAAVVSTAPAAPSLEPPRFELAYLNNPAPAYPALSRKTGEQGRVMLRVCVNPSGQVEAIAIHQSSGFQRLDEAAMSAVRRWRFVPARAGERAIAGIALVPVAFEIRG